MTLLIQSIALVLFVIGCASVQKDYGHMSQAKYQSQPQLRQALLNGNEPLTEAAIQKILSSKVVLPQKINLAIVRLSDSMDGLDFQIIDNQLAEQFYKKENWGSRIQSLIPVPQVILSKPVTISGLRKAAVLLQADALLVIKPVSYVDWKFQWFEKDTAKGMTSLEVLLLDSRTSVVPYTSMITETVEVPAKKSDYNQYELMNRAKKASETKAMLQIAPAVQKFLKEVP